MKLLVLLLALHLVLFVECTVRRSKFHHSSHPRLSRRHHEREASEKHDGWRRGARHNSTTEGEEETNKWGVDGKQESKTNHKHWQHSAGNQNESEEEFHRNETTHEWGSEGPSSQEGHDLGAHRRGGQAGWTHGKHPWGHHGHEGSDRPGRDGSTRPDHESNHSHNKDEKDRMPGGHRQTTPEGSKPGNGSSGKAGDQDRSKTHKDGHQIGTHDHRHGSRGHHQKDDENRPGKHHSHGGRQGKGTFTGPQGALGGQDGQPKDEATSPAPWGQGIEEKGPKDDKQKDGEHGGWGQGTGPAESGEIRPKTEEPFGQNVNEGREAPTEDTNAGGDQNGGLNGGFGFGWAFGHGLEGGKFNPALFCEVSRSLKCLAIQNELCPGQGRDAAMNRECIRNYCSNREARCEMLRKMANRCNHAVKNEIYAREECN